MNIPHRRVVTLGVAALCAALAACTAVDAPATPGAAPTQTVSASPAPVDPWKYVEPALVERLKDCGANNTALKPDGEANIDAMVPCISKVIKVTIKGKSVSYETPYKGLRFTGAHIITITSGARKDEYVQFDVSGPAKGDHFFVAVVRTRTIGNNKWSPYDATSDKNDLGSGWPTQYLPGNETELFICVFNDDASKNKPATTVAWKWGDILNLMQR